MKFIGQMSMEELAAYVCEALEKEAEKRLADKSIKAEDFLKS